MNDRPPLPEQDHTSNPSQPAEGQTYHNLKDNDILCGRRGHANSKHPGNQNFSQLIKETLGEYQNEETRVERTLVVAKVVSALRRDGVKFLKLDEKTKQYTELSSEQAHTKVGHAIRDQLKNLGSRQKSKRASPLPTGLSTEQKRRHSDGRLKSQESMVRQDSQQKRNSDPSIRWPQNGSRNYERAPSAAGSFPPKAAMPVSSTRMVGNARPALSNDVASGLPNVLPRLGQGFSRLEPPSLPTQPLRAMGTLASVNGLQVDHLSQQNVEHADAARAAVRPMPNRVESHVVSASLHSPLPVDAEAQFEAGDLEEVSDILGMPF